MSEEEKPKRKMSPALAAKMAAMKKQKEGEQEASAPQEGQAEKPKAKLSPMMAARMAAKKTAKPSGGNQPEAVDENREPQPHDLVYKVIKDEFGDAVSDLDGNALMPFFAVEDVSAWQAIAFFMREDSRLRFNYLACLSGVDYADGRLGVVYNLESVAEHKHKLAVKVFCDKDDPRIPSVAEIWLTADWHEREAYDMYGIVFEGHPDLRRILCPEDWEGYPLRKDYKVQEVYRGIKVPY